VKPIGRYPGFFKIPFQIQILKLIPSSTTHFRLYGCYENLVGGQLADALQDVSGGVAESINVRKHLDIHRQDPNGRLFQLLRTAFDQQALIVAAIAARREEIEQSLDCGLVKGHAYAVTAVRYIDLDAGGNQRQVSIALVHPSIHSGV